MSFATALARAADPVAMAREVGLEPDAWQVAVLRSESSRILLNCCRQSGKSTMAALAAVHTAFYEPGSLILLLSRGERQSRELFRKAVGFYRQLGRPVAAEAENKLSLELENGSRIESLPGSEQTIRGYSNVDLLVIDEAARVPDDTYFSVLPMLAVSRGRLLALSTPWGRRGWFYESWRALEAPWQRFEIPASQCPRITPDVVASYRETAGDWFYRQEFECEFLDAGSQVFATDAIERAFDTSDAEWGESWDLL